MVNGTFNYLELMSTTCTGSHGNCDLYLLAKEALGIFEEG